MLNDYLNGYTTKLSRANPKDPTEIKIISSNSNLPTAASTKRLTILIFILKMKCTLPTK